MHRVLAVAVLVVVGFTAAPPAAPAARGKAKLTRFGDCGALGQYARKYAGRYSTTGGPMPRTPVFVPPMTTEGPMPVSGAPVATDGSGGESFSTTNIQEAGVFEPDIVKTDGKLLFTITSQGVFKVVDTSPATTHRPRVARPRRGFGYGHQLLLDGRADRVLAMWTGYDNGNGMERTTLAMIDVSDPAAPKVERSLEVDGSILSARRTDRTVRAVMALRPPALMEPVEERTDAPDAPGCRAGASPPRRASPARAGSSGAAPSAARGRSPASSSSRCSPSTSTRASTPSTPTP